MWGYMIGICALVNGEIECQDQQFVPNFSSEIACEVHSVIQTALINYDLYHIDGVYDMWVAPSTCISIPPNTSNFFNGLK